MGVRISFFRGSSRGFPSHRNSLGLLAILIFPGRRMIDEKVYDLEARRVL
jgi:hypothetical protein